LAINAIVVTISGYHEILITSPPFAQNVKVLIGINQEMGKKDE